MHVILAGTDTVKRMCTEMRPLPKQAAAAAVPAAPSHDHLFICCSLSVQYSRAQQQDCAIQAGQCTPLLPLLPPCPATTTTAGKYIPD